MVDVAQKMWGEFVFYDRFVGLCKERGVSPSAVMVSIGLNKSNATFWKNGSIPKGDTLQKLSDYFGVSVDYLLDISPENANELHAVICAIPSSFHSEIFQKLSEIGIPIEKIVQESKHGAFIGEGFIVEDLTTEEQIKVSDAINEVMFRYMPHQAQQAPQPPVDPPQSPPEPQEGTDTTPPPEGGERS